MARKDLSRRRQRDNEDRLSALPDDLLLLILRRLDSRTAHGAAALSKRWAHLPRELAVLELKVTDTLPERYRRCLLLRRKARMSQPVFPHAGKLTDIAGRYQRRAMRSMVTSVRSLLLSSSGGGPHRRSVDRLSVEFFAETTSACINSLIVEAVDSWGVKDLVLVATPTERIVIPHPPVYSFPHGCISRKPGENSRLQSLKLSNCFPPPLEGFVALTTLVLQDLPASTPAAVYGRVIDACPQLQILHLISCESYRDRLVLDAPMSGIRELLVDGPLIALELRSLPKLQCLTILHGVLRLSSSAASPCLEHVSLVFSIHEPEGSHLYNFDLKIIAGLITRFFQAATSITDLALRFVGPGMWIALKNPVCPMANLRRLLLADVPSCWDGSGSGPHLLIDAAPLLESIHVHVPKSEKEQDQKIAPWMPSTARHYHRHLKELVVVGFQRTERHLHLVRYVVEVSTVLSRVALFKHGHVKEKGPCGWEMVTPVSKWSNQERFAVLGRICSPTAQIEVVLG